MEKQYILDEIARVAKLDGGKPPGSNRFLTETGIKTTDWHGKYWVRWGDALIEAGFEPNQRTARYEDEGVIAKLVGFIRELGRYPVKGELVMKSRSDQSFPSTGAFRRRGDKSQLRAKVVDYCQRHDGFGDVIRICEAVAEPQNGDTTEPRRNGDSATVLGDVYLIKSGRYFKIGHSNASGRREREIALQLPDKAGIVHVIKTDDPRGIEEYWHRRFAEKRKNGEWFDLDRAELAAFKRRKTM
ncbi:MAG TPA: GIY-YIG nuclease family protein [Opitutaceae bacterium]|jgi:hypothetical protein